MSGVIGSGRGDTANMRNRMTPKDAAKVLASTLHHCQRSEWSQMNPRERSLTLTPDPTLHKTRCLQ